MKTTRSLCQILLVLLGISCVLCAGTERAFSQDELVYSEDFESDPGYVSPEPENVYWNEAQGNYYANTIDRPPWPAFYVGYSPEFPVVTGDFRVQFNFMIVTPDWGCYPGVAFINTLVPDPDTHDGYHCSMICSYNWSDHVIRKFMLRNRDTGQDYETSQHPTAGRWYRFTVSYDATNNEVDWLVEDIHDSPATVFYELSNASFTMEEGFNQLRIGDIQMSPEYGDESDIRVDNVHILDVGGPSPVNNASWAVIKALYR